MVPWVGVGEAYACSDGLKPSGTKLTWPHPWRRRRKHV